MGCGALIAAGALRLLARAAAMQACIKEEREFRGIVLAFGALAGSSGAVVFALAIARWQLDAVTTQVLCTTRAWTAATLAMALHADRCLATHLESREDEPNSEHDGIVSFM